MEIDNQGTKVFRTFIYGSLRRGEYNHERFRGFGTYYRGTGNVHGALLKSLGSYPAVVPSPDLSDIVKGEIYDLPEDLHKVILKMENGAGYIYFPVQVHVEANAEEQPEKTVPIDASLYMFRTPALIERIPAIKGGDWTKRDE